MDAINLLLERYTPIFNAIEMVAVFFFTLTMLELVWDWAAKTGRQFSETLANAMIAALYAVSDVVIGGVLLIAAYYLIQPYTLFSFEMTPLLWAAAIFLADFTYYWMHRLEHEIRFLWAYHVTHHSSPEFDLSTSYRLSPVEGLFEWVFLVPMLIIGFDPIASLISLVIVAQYQTWVHTQKIGKLGILDKIINTPSAHRVHHGTNPKYIDKNYGGVLMIWDHLFGTYQAEEEKVVFGITEPVNSINPFVITFHEFIAIWKDCWSAKNWSDRKRYMFSPPGWKPTGFDDPLKARPDGKEDYGTQKR